MKKFIIIKTEQNGGRFMEMNVVGTFDNYTDAKKTFEADFAQKCADFGVTPEYDIDCDDWGSKSETEFEIYDEDGLYAVIEKLVIA